MCWKAWGYMKWIMVITIEISVDEVCRRVKRAPGYVNGIIAVLEMKGLVRTSMGKVFVAK